jgi:hypothetical protein
MVRKRKNIAAPQYTCMYVCMYIYTHTYTRECTHANKKQIVHNFALDTILDCITHAHTYTVHTHILHCITHAHTYTVHTHILHVHTYIIHLYS